MKKRRLTGMYCLIYSTSPDLTLETIRRWEFGKIKEADLPPTVSSVLTLLKVLPIQGKDRKSKLLLKKCKLVNSTFTELEACTIFSLISYVSQTGLTCLQSI